MSSIEVEQAVFTSTDSGSIKGYHLVSRSAGIDRRLAQELCRWAPSHGSLAGTSSDSWSLNYFPLHDDWVAVTRTLYGAPEYSCRGGFQVVTRMLALRAEQFASYDHNPLALARTALAMGHLRSLTGTGANLATVSLPSCPMIRSATAPGHSAETDALLTEVAELLQNDRRVAILGHHDPLIFFEHLVASVPFAQRPAISFTTGLKPSVRRCFRLHFLPSTDAALCRRLGTQGIVCVDAEKAWQIA